MMTIHYCQKCGHGTTKKVPLGDSKIRQVCVACGTIHYENPKVICGALVIWENQILLCRRAIEPRYGLWTLPAGYMELAETMAEGAARETFEEAEAHINIEGLYCMYDIPHIGQIYALFKAQLKDGIFGAGPETIETRLFKEEDIPWDSLAFPSVKQTLRHYFKDKLNQHYPLHFETIHSEIDQP